jgi:sporulation protein YlmC with PRC-barrel domain
MTHRTMFGATALLGLALAAGPALAQSTTNTPTRGSNGVPGTTATTNSPTVSTTNPTRGSDAKPGDQGNAAATSSTSGMGGGGLLGGSSTHADKTLGGDLRASKLIGSTVYNDQNQSVGTLDDILMSKDKQPDRAVVSVGGFLGVGSKLVEVPYDQLQFQDGNKVVIPGASKDKLNGMPSFSYNNDNGPKKG